MTKIPANKIARFIAANEKIFDSNESTNAAILCSISTKVPPNCIAVLICAKRITGTGSFVVFPNEGTASCLSIDMSEMLTVAISNQRLKIAQTVAGEDFDVYMFGYWVEGTVITA